MEGPKLPAEAVAVPLGHNNGTLWYKRPGQTKWEYLGTRTPLTEVLAIEATGHYKITFDENGVHVRKLAVRPTEKPTLICSQCGKGITPKICVLRGRDGEFRSWGNSLPGDRVWCVLCRDEIYAYSPNPHLRQAATDYFRRREQEYREAAELSQRKADVERRCPVCQSRSVNGICQNYGCESA